MHRLHNVLFIGGRVYSGLSRYISLHLEQVKGRLQQYGHSSLMHWSVELPSLPSFTKFRAHQLSDRMKFVPTGIFILFY